jgi:hypothetical protein
MYRQYVEERGLLRVESALLTGVVSFICVRSEL